MFEFLMINLTLKLIYEQHSIFDKIVEAVNNRRREVFFLHGYGRTDKTFM